MYHNVQTKYIPKRQHFSYKGMVARTQLAGLDHNANTGREQATSGESEGELHYKVVYPKRSKQWIAKLIMEQTTRDHLHPLLDAIMERKTQNPSGRSATIRAPHIPHNIASTPPLEKQTSLKGMFLDFLILDVNNTKYMLPQW